MIQRRGDAGLDLARVLKPDPAHTDGFGHRGEIWVLELGAEWKKTGGFLFELDKAERAVVEHDHLYRQAELYEAEEVAHQHREPAVT